MVCGGLWLLFKRKIYLDPKTNEQILEITLPRGASFKTNIPALAFFVLGFIPLLFPVCKLDPGKYHLVETARITGNLGVLEPHRDMVVVYASVANDPVQASGTTYRLQAPFVLGTSQDYKVLFIVNGYVLYEAPVSWQEVRNGEIPLDPHLPPDLKPPSFKAKEIDPVSVKYE